MSSGRRPAVRRRIGGRALPLPAVVTAALVMAVLAGALTTALLVRVTAGPGSSATEALDHQNFIARFAHQVDAARAARYLETADRAGLRAAVDAVDADSRTDPAAGASAHDYVHMLGMYALRMYATPAEAYRACDDRFTQGCGHGVVAAYLDREGVHDAAVPRLCEDVFAATFVQGENTCWHGLGHAFAHHHDHDLGPALRLCDLLDQGGKRESCWDGAFMDNIVSTFARLSQQQELTGHLAGYYDAARPFHPCPDAAPKYQQVCYRQQATQIFHLAGGDWARAGGICEGAPASGQRMCFVGLGMMIGGVTEEHARAFRQNCARMPAAGRDPCLLGAIGNQFTDYREVFEICAAFTAVDDRRSCYHVAGYRVAITSAGAEERSRRCAEIADRTYREDCERGAATVPLRRG